MSLFFGVEAIGMRYVAAVASLSDGTILTGNRELCDSLGLHTTPRDEFRERLYHTIRDLCSRIGPGLDQLEDITLCIGISGVNHQHDYDIELPDELTKCNLNMRRVICTGDIELILASHVDSLSTPASGIICNTGSTAFARNCSGSITRIGGWGPAIGDNGSGYEMGKSALRALGQELDAGEPPSLLWRAISEWLQGADKRVGSWHTAVCEWRCHAAHYLERMGAKGDTRRAFCSFVHQLELRGTLRPVASGLTIPLVEAARLGDGRSIGIVQSGVAELARQHHSAVMRAGLKNVLS